MRNFELKVNMEDQSMQYSYDDGFDLMGLVYAIRALLESLEEETGHKDLKQNFCMLTLSIIGETVLFIIMHYIMRIKKCLR